jgi:hypothetical protein
MRFSIVFDDNGTILAASVDGEGADTAILGPGVSSGCFDISGDLPDAELQETVERLLIDMDVTKFAQVSARKEADDAQP